MKLWLDDIRPAPAGFTHVHSWAELRQILEGTVIVEQISFDHDLGENEPTGYDIIKMYAANFMDKWPKQISCHSANPVGRDNILMFADFIRRNFPLDK